MEKPNEEFVRMVLAYSASPKPDKRPKPYHDEMSAMGRFVAENKGKI